MRTTLAAATLLALIPFSASAVDWHLGIGAVAELDGRTPSIGGIKPDTQTAYTVVAGVELGQGFGIEVAGVDLGKARLSNIADAGYRVSGDLWSLGVTWSPDTGPVRPYAKLGWFTRDEKGSALTIAGPRRVDFSDDGLMAEVGGRWFVTDSFALRAGYAWYDFDRRSDGSVQVLAEVHFR